MPQFFFPDKKSIQPDFSETARYLGYQKIVTPESQIQTLIQSCAEKMHSILQPQATWELFDLTISPTEQNDVFNLKFADLNFDTQDLGRNLKNCKKVALMAATIGPQVDALIRRSQHSSPVEAAVFQATGAMYIEQLVELLNKNIQEQAALSGFKTKPRYSPGYGDIPLTMQKDFFRLLPCTRIGITLMDTLIMSPEKSVTAFIGLF